VSDQKALIQLLKDRSLQTGDFVLASGQRSTYYIDARPTTMSAQGQRLIGRLGLEAIRKAGWHPEAIGGLTLGADPVAYAIASASAEHPPAIDAFSVRKEAKSHGAKRRIEGNFSLGIPVVVVEDVVTSGGSAQQAVETVTAEGGKVLGVLSVVDRLQGGRERLESAGFMVVVLTTIHDLGL
jgi:orotate phosphoribosyltransferase